MDAPTFDHERLVTQSPTNAARRCPPSSSRLVLCRLEQAFGILDFLATPSLVQGTYTP
jgi:hypothetical protein